MWHEEWEKVRENGSEKCITANTTLQVKKKSATEHTG